MDRWLGHLAGMADLPRMLYRSAHIYLLFAALLNLLLGLYGDDHPRGWRRGITKLGSVLILIAPVMILIGFDREASRTDFERPFVGFAIYFCFAGVLIHAIARVSHFPSLVSARRFTKSEELRQIRFGPPTPSPTRRPS